MKKFFPLLLLLLPLLLASGCLSRHVQVRRDLEYGNIAGRSLRLDLYTTKKPATPTPLPVLVWIHGGAWKNGSKDRCPIAFMARTNVAIVSIDYRPSTEAAFPAQLHDCKGAIRWLRAHSTEYGLDPDHIGVIGASAGGHLAALLGTTAEEKALEGNVGGNLQVSSRVQAVCALYPPTDLNQLVTDPFQRTNPENNVGRLLGGTVESKQEVAALASPIRYVTATSAPFFLMHGEKDELVPKQQSEILHAALQKAGVDSTLVIIPNKGHGIRAPRPVALQIFAFLQKYLVPKGQDRSVQSP